MSVEHEVRALLADRYAAAVDRASSEGDAGALLRAGDKLLELLDTLPLVAIEPTTAKGGDAGDGTGEHGAILGIIHGGPELGDAADS
jgi:hypothetical protein